MNEFHDKAEYLLPQTGSKPDNLFSHVIEKSLQKESAQFCLFLLNQVIPSEPGLCQQTGLSWSDTHDQLVELHQEGWIEFRLHDRVNQHLLEFGYFQMLDTSDNQEGFLAAFIPWHLPGLYTQGDITKEDIKLMVGTLVSLGKDHSLQLRNMTSFLEENRRLIVKRKKGGVV